MAFRSRLASFVLIAFAAFALFAAATFAWYGYRVSTELRSGSWRTPTTIVGRDGESVAELYGSEWRRTDPIVLEDLPDHACAGFASCSTTPASKESSPAPRRSPSASTMSRCASWSARTRSFPRSAAGPSRI